MYNVYGCAVLIVCSLDQSLGRPSYSAAILAIDDEIVFVCFIIIELSCECLGTDGGRFTRYVVGDCHCWMLCPRLALNIQAGYIENGIKSSILERDAC